MPLITVGRKENVTPEIKTKSWSEEFINFVRGTTGQNKKVATNLNNNRIDKDAYFAKLGLQATTSNTKPSPLLTESSLTRSPIRSQICRGITQISLRELSNVDFSSKLGQLLANQVNAASILGENALTLLDITKYEKFCDGMYLDSNGKPHQLRTRTQANFPITYPMSRKLKNKSTHVYCFNRHQKKERMKTIRTGLNKRARMLKRLCKPCTVVVERIVAYPQYRFFVKKKQTPNCEKPMNAKSLNKPALRQNSLPSKPSIPSIPTKPTRMQPVSLTSLNQARPNSLPVVSLVKMPNSFDRTKPHTVVSSTQNNVNASLMKSKQTNIDSFLIRNSANVNTHASALPSIVPTVNSKTVYSQSILKRNLQVNNDTTKQNGSVKNSILPIYPEMTKLTIGKEIILDGNVVIDLCSDDESDEVVVKPKSVASSPRSSVSRASSVDTRQLRNGEKPVNNVDKPPEKSLKTMCKLKECKVTLKDILECIEEGEDGLVYVVNPTPKNSVKNIPAIRPNYTQGTKRCFGEISDNESKNGNNRKKIRNTDGSSSTVNCEVNRPNSSMSSKESKVASSNQENVSSNNNKKSALTPMVIQFTCCICDCVQYVGSAKLKEKIDKHVSFYHGSYKNIILVQKTSEKSGRIAVDLKWEKEVVNKRLRSTRS